MAKTLTALFSVVLFSALLLSSGKVTVCVGGKSQGEFYAHSEVYQNMGFDGVSFSLSQAEFENLISSYSFEKIAEFSFENAQILYFYSPKVLKKEVIKGKRVNLHAVKKGETYTVGVPFIYFGY